jgi:hypothetical protein
MMPIDTIPIDPKQELATRIAAMDERELAGQVAGLPAALGAARTHALSESPGDQDARDRSLLLIAANGQPLARRLRAGSWVVYSPKESKGSPRRWFTLDRSAHVMETLDWGSDGKLRRARVRLPDGGWVEVRPGTATHVLLGAADAVALIPATGGDPTPLTVGGTLDWAAIDHLPALDRPGALPPGGGSALLTLISGLITDQQLAGAQRSPVPVRYRGPYPTRALFDRLLMAFRPRGELDQARDAFTAGAESIALSGQATEPPVDFVPAPAERLLAAPGTLACLRDGIEEVVDGGRVYARDDPLVTLWAGREDLILAGLAFLGEPLEEHLIFDPEGDLVARIDDRIAGDAEGDDVLEAAFDERWRQALAALLVAESATLLARPLLDLALTMPIAWGATDGRWVESRDGGLVVHGALPRRFQARRAAAPAVEHEPLAARFIAEVARAIGDPLRRAAQERVEAALAAPAGPAPTHPREANLGAATNIGAERLTAALLSLGQDLAKGRALATPTTTAPA